MPQAFLANMGIFFCFSTHATDTLLIVFTSTQLLQRSDVKDQLPERIVWLPQRSEEDLLG